MSSTFTRNLTFVVLGTVFGFLLSRAGATDPALISGLLLFENLHLLWVIVTAIAAGAALNALAHWRQWKAIGQREPMHFNHKPFVKWLVPGALLFGIGWGLTGVCPGTAPAMVGEGRWFAAVILVGILAGTWLTGWLMSLGGQGREAAATSQKQSPVEGSRNEPIKH